MAKISDRITACEPETLRCLECALDLLMRCCVALEGRNHRLYSDLIKFCNELVLSPPPVDYEPYV